METATFLNSLSPALREFIHDQVNSGRFANPDDYVRSLLEAEQQKMARQEVNRLIEEAIASGPPAPMTRADWDDLRQRTVQEFTLGSF